MAMVSASLALAMQYQSEGKFLVSVFMVTYNHEKYLSEAIESVLMQKTNFSYQLIIGEDCSSDGTREIVRRYAEEHPTLIKAIFNPQNLGPGRNADTVFKECTGKYVAMCEGDDYWTDPHKLQKQVDFLEDNPDFAICFHNMQIVYEGNPHLNRISNTRQKEITTINNLARGNYIHTASCIFRNNLYEIPDWFHQCPVGDYPLHLLNAQYGKIKFIDEIMGVYRVHKGGIWENKDSSYRVAKWIEMLEIIRYKFNKEINNILNNSLCNYSFTLARYYLKNSEYDKCNFYIRKMRSSNHNFINSLRIAILLPIYFLKNQMHKIFSNG